MTVEVGDGMGQVHLAPIHHLDGSGFVYDVFVDVSDGWVEEAARSPDIEALIAADPWAGRLTDPRDTLHAGGGCDPLDRVVADLGVVDRAMARVLRQMVQAGPRDGLSVRRQVSLMAGATGMDVGFIDRAVQVLAGMPRTQTAFDDGLLSWSQVRGIVVEARRLTTAQRGLLDDALAATVAQGRLRGEPDRVVETAGDLAARLDVKGEERAEAAEERQQRLVLQPDFDGWGSIHGMLAPEVYSSTCAALDAVADAPVAADAPPATDDDGRVLPRAARPVTARGTQLAEALGRMAALILGGTDGEGTWRRARPRATVIANLADLLPTAHDPADGSADDVTTRPGDGCSHGGGAPATHPRPTIDDADADGLGSVTSRLLLRRGNGRRRLTRALTRTLVDDADIVAVFTDSHGMPVAIGDSYAPITPAMRRAVTARDQGCRAPGCTAPPEHCDVHHVIPRHHRGRTEVTNLALLCRPCHVRLDRHRWQMRMDPDDATLTIGIGRHTYTTRPRLHGPALPDPPGGPHPGRPPDPGSDPGQPPDRSGPPTAQVDTHPSPPSGTPPTTTRSPSPTAATPPGQPTSDSAEGRLSGHPPPADRQPQGPDSPVPF